MPMAHVLYRYRCGHTWRSSLMVEAKREGMAQKFVEAQCQDCQRRAQERRRRK